MEEDFFRRDSKAVAKDLLGTRIGIEGLEAEITETEAYMEDDPVSHAHGGKTERTRIMYESTGRIYVYLCYGIHYLLNITTNPDSAGCVLIRAAKPLEGLEKMRQRRDVEDETKLLDGPGKLCEAFGVDKDLNGSSYRSLGLEKSRSPKYETSGRIGISKAQDRQLRFYVPGSRYLSR
jgi:DNA-3-methyladenine glycosylase